MSLLKPYSGATVQIQAEMYIHLWTEQSAVYCKQPETCAALSVFQSCWQACDLCCLLQVENDLASAKENFDIFKHWPFFIFIGEYMMSKSTSAQNWSSVQQECYNHHTKSCISKATFPIIVTVLVFWSYLSDLQVHLLRCTVYNVGEVAGCDCIILCNLVQIPFKMFFSYYGLYISVFMTV